MHWRGESSETDEASGQWQWEIRVAHDARRCGHHGRDGVDGGHRRHDVPQHHEVGERLAFEVRRGKELHGRPHGRKSLHLDQVYVLDLLVELVGQCHLTYHDHTI